MGCPPAVKYLVDGPGKTATYSDSPTGSAVDSGVKYSVLL